ncbi:MAG: type IIA DNA topoisomerase subunit B [Akkermansiaceae bacterium]|nr:type IIA DNA topoisomerase subunit B [Akkermansiaceae bacterium]
MAGEYTEENIKSLTWQEHIRARAGMYIGKLGDGSMADDGPYVLLKEVIDNSIDEFVMGAGKKIIIRIAPDGMCEVRDFGRGIPLGKLFDCAAQINTGGKYDNEAFQKSVGLNGVGLKAVNALSSYFCIQSFREGQTRRITFAAGEMTDGSDIQEATDEPDGTKVTYMIDRTLFAENAAYNTEYVTRMCRYYTYLNAGLSINLNGKNLVSRNGLLDLLKEEMGTESLYPPIQLKGDDIEIVFTHTDQYGEEYYSFANGQHTTMGGFHQSAFREAIVKTLQNFYKKNYDPADIRSGIVAAVSLRVIEPVFESQTKTKLGSNTMGPGKETIRTFVSNFVAKELDNYLHRNPDIAEALEDKIKESEKTRKKVADVQGKVAKERAKKARVHNKKLRDCRVHYDTKHKRAKETMLFITEGDSASGSITTARDAETQAVFSLRGKPANSFGMNKNAILETNEELDFLHLALNIDRSIEELRYNKIVIATDADVDGMHIRLLLLTFFIQYFPELIQEGHLYILQTPLFRVRNKQKTIYCYTENERDKAVKALGKNPEITRFKGLGEISPQEFKGFIGEDIRLESVSLENAKRLRDLLRFYMGENTVDRRQYIMDNLRIEEDPA